MSNVNGDIVLERLEKKVLNKEEVSRQELVALTFTPVMGGKLSKVDKIIPSIKLVLCIIEILNIII